MTDEEVLKAIHNELTEDELFVIINRILKPYKEVENQKIIK